ncbi:MAG: SUMF1/EgtB/PvdO family nonheme iron enzyme [Anaerolineae bacterium]|nr:SUMF1/EgtB/PvdO family nonheme iron enzyme [Anaerolineae bacterium]
MADQSHVFISYSRKDSDVLRQVKQSLDAAGIPHWTDEHIEPGTRSWRRAIEKAIREAGCLVCILSPDAVESYWVEQELVFAEKLNKPIQLLLARGDETDAVPFGYGTYQWIDIRTDYDAGIRRLLSALGPIFEITPASHPEMPEPIVKSDPAPQVEVAMPPLIHLTSTDLPILTLEEAPVDYNQIKPVTRNRDWTPIIRVINGIEMCLVPPGCFLMGSDDGHGHEHPIHKCCVDQPFWIGRYLVTNAQYDEAVKAGICQLSLNANNERFNQLRQPIVGVTWHEAVKYAAWRGMRLPSESEWEYSACGPDNLIWPWGNEFVAANLIYEENSGGRTAFVGSKLGGMSWVGALDMSGNVWEWCQTKWRWSYHEPEDNDPEGDTPRVLRGGSWLDFFLRNARATSRKESDPFDWSGDCGFRVMYDPIDTD